MRQSFTMFYIIWGTIIDKKSKIIVTGVAGFIGFHLTKKLLHRGYNVLGIDNLNNYYDRNLKLCRLNEIDKGLSKLKKTKKSFSFHEADITNLNILKNIFSKFQPNKVVNLAAQAGVRYSLKSPQTYINSNVTGFMNILECSRAYNVKGLIYASSSSVYGNNQKTPFSIFDRVDKPLSIYAASKRSNELMAYTYSHLYQLSTTGLRFFFRLWPMG